MVIREVYHTDPLNYRTGFNIAVARDVWGTRPVIVYDSFLVGNEYRGERDSCGLRIDTLPAVSFSPPTYTLIQDSGWIVDQDVVGSPNPVPHPDAEGLFIDFGGPTDSVIQVFELPRLIRLATNGTYLWRGVLGLTYPSGTLYPSIWLNAREIQFPMAGGPSPQSVLAHELTHATMDAATAGPWDDNSTSFLHIQTHIGIVKRLRQSPAQVPGPVVSVAATDLNRRNLIVAFPYDACLDSRFASQVMRPVP